MKRVFVVLMMLLSVSAHGVTIAYLPFTGECAKDNDRNMLAITISQHYGTGTVDLVPFARVKAAMESMDWINPEENYDIAKLSKIASDTDSDFLLWGHMNRFGYFPMGDMVKYQFNVDCMAFDSNAAKIVFNEQSRDQNIQVWSLRKDQVFKNKEDLFRKVGRKFIKFYESIRKTTSNETSNGLTKKVEKL